MIKITNEINGKLYELEICYGDSPCECDALPGVWKEVRDAD